MTKLQLNLARTYEENGYTAALNFWAENQDEIKSLSDKERDDLKKMMLRYCKINKDESSALSISQDRNSPQNKEIMSFLFELARIYNDGKTVDKNTVKSERLYEMLLEGGDSDDLYKLGEMYKSGDGVARNESKAAECFKKSAVGGNKLAAYRLGEMYMLGCGVEKNTTEAENWYNAANAERNVYSNTISRMVIPDGITNISKSAFEGFKSLRSVAIPNSVNRIEPKAFSGCTALENITFSNEKISIEKDAFEFCDLLNEETRRIVERRSNSFFVFVNGAGDIKNFIITRYPITQELYESVMGNNPSGFRGIKRPVENVSLNSAIEFCNRLSVRDGLTPYYNVVNDFFLRSKSYEVITSANGYRLPTISEWMYAANGGSQVAHHKYVGSNKLSNVAWFKENSEGRTHDVGEKEPNELGIFDMLGNIWEWCFDYNDTSSWYLMGGSFYSGTSIFADREKWINKWNGSPEFGDCRIGFRVIRNAE